MTSAPVPVLGFHPSARGFGWALFSSRRAIVAWGAVEVSGKDKNAKALGRFDAILKTYRPKVLVLEKLDKRGSAARPPRVHELSAAVRARARAKRLRIFRCTRTKIAQTFSLQSTATRADVAAAVVNTIPVLRPRWPGPRKAWDSEHHSLGLFCAAACVLTWFAQAQDA